MVAKMTMTQSSGLYLLRAQISLAFKTPQGRDFGDFERPYGAGFNAEVEVGWDWTESLKKSRAKELFDEMIRQIDHRHLGMDAPELHVTTPESLLAFCVEHFKKKSMPAKTIRFRRGEDIHYRFEN